MLNRKNTELTAALDALRVEFNDHETANQYGFTDLEDRLSDVESRVDDLESVNSDDLESRVEELEEQVQAQANIIRDLELDLADIVARVIELEAK
jgi:TolA-binding protein